MSSRAPDPGECTSHPCRIFWVFLCPPLPQRSSENVCACARMRGRVEQRRRDRKEAPCSLDSLWSCHPEIMTWGEIKSPPLSQLSRRRLLRFSFPSLANDSEYTDGVFESSSDLGEPATLVSYTWDSSIFRSSSHLNSSSFLAWRARALILAHPAQATVTEGKRLRGRARGRFLSRTALTSLAGSSTNLTLHLIITIYT